MAQIVGPKPLPHRIGDRLRLLKRPPPLRRPNKLG
jgi:hypothetical protein